MMADLKKHIEDVINKKLVDFPQLSAIHSVVFFICDAYTTTASKEWGKVKRFMFSKIVDSQRLHDILPKTVRITHQVDYFLIWMTDFSTIDFYRQQIDAVLEFLKEFERPIVIIPRYDVKFNWRPYLWSLMTVQNSHLRDPPPSQGGSRRFKLIVINPAICEPKPCTNLISKIGQPT